MSTLTQEDTRKIEAFLESHPRLAVGLGHVDKPCSVAAINLALTGELTDRIPDCMSEVVGAWIIDVQDVMPAVVRNSARWRRLLPQAAGTGRDHEKERLDVILDWMWGTVLPTMQPVADDRGFGAEWKAMCKERTADAAYAASNAASAYAASNAAAYASNFAADAAANAAAAADATPVATSDYWATVDPAGLLERLIKIGELK